jgi:hypothetical protein
MEFRKIAKISEGQDGAIAAGFLFRPDSYAVCRVFRMADIETAQGKGVRSVSRFDFDQASAAMPHSNAVCFGKRLLATDEFPLLYTNIYNSYAGAEDRRLAELCAYRITRRGFDFSTSLVQRIRLSFASEVGIWRSGEGDVRPYGNFLVDTENGVLYAYVMRDREAVTRFFALRLPPPKVEDIILTEDDIIGYFDTPYMRYMQGGCIRHGLIYSVEGFSSGENYPAIRVIDPAQKKQLLYRRLSDFGLSLEPELITFRADTCYYSDCSGELYEVSNIL